MPLVPKRFAGIVPPGFQMAQSEELETCPYNRSHYCLRSKITKHVDKCRRAFVAAHSTPEQDVDLFGCKYTPTHMVPAIEIPWHQERCPFRTHPHLQLRAEDLQKLAPPPPAEKKLTLNDLSIKELEVIITELDWRGEEDWDVEAALFSKRQIPYNPIVGVVQGAAPWIPMGLTKSQRKAFQKIHREVASVKRGGTFLTDPKTLPLPKSTRDRSTPTPWL